MVLSGFVKCMSRGTAQKEPHIICLVRLKSYYVTQMGKLSKYSASMCVAVCTDTHITKGDDFLLPKGIACDIIMQDMVYFNDCGIDP